MSHYGREIYQMNKLTIEKKDANSDCLLNRMEASLFLKSIGCPISYRSLCVYAIKNNQGSGPPYIKIRDKSVRYRKSELEEWAIKQIKRIE